MPADRDIRKLGPSELCRLVNSTPIGSVLSERKLKNHRDLAGYRIGTDSHVDLTRYAAWLIHRRHTRPKLSVVADPIQAERERLRKRSAEIFASGRDIAPLPEVKNPARRASCETDFKRFCETYFPLTFHLGWSEDHLKVIGQIEESVLRGGLFSTAMPRGSGKALALNTPLPTPDGWTTMGKVKVGDLLYDESGDPCRVTFATEVMENRLCYRVTFDDGEAIDCDADHLWTVNDRFSRKNPLTLSTREIAGRYVLSESRGWTEYRYTVPICEPIRGESPDSWPVAPYMLGVWLGDGTTTAGQVTIGDHDFGEMRTLIERHENFNPKGRRKLSAKVGTYSVGMGRRLESAERAAIEDRVIAMTAAGATCSEIIAETGAAKRTVSNIRFRSKDNPGTASAATVSLANRLRWIGVLGDKHIPAAYLRASEDDRLELLRGLMDTDGSISGNGSTAEYVTKLPALRDGVMELLAGLGFKRRCRVKTINDRPYYRITFTPSDGRRVFGLTRKAARQETRDVRISATRRIVSAEPIGSVPVRCIQVDSPSHLYLCGRGMVPTHNTTLAETACIWAVVYGHRDFVCLIGSDEGKAGQMLDSIKTEFEANDLLGEDFPEACYPIERLEGISNRCNGQMFEGERTHIGWTAKELVLPTIPDSKASGAIVKVAGITGGLRGMKFKRADGKTVRPSLVVIDDPQTDESARSPSQCQTRERILAGAILGLAGPGKKISGIMPCTVIREGDMADSILDRDKHPDWNGTRTKMVYSFPSDEKLWEEYGRIRADGLRAGDAGKSATAFYLEHREAMDAGSRVAWAERFNPDEASAIQHAMNLRLRDERAFFAEYQNEPLPEDDVREDDLTPDQILAKLNRQPRGLIPTGCNRLTAFVDVQGSILYYVVAAWEDDFTGYVVDYGTFPDQKRAYFTLRDLKVTLAHATKAPDLEGQIYGGLKILTDALIEKTWTRDDGTDLKLDRCMIDANWGASTEVVYQFCKQSAHSGVLMPSHGKYVGASSLPMGEYYKKVGEKAGFNWRIKPSPHRGLRYVLYDTNFWKSFIHTRLSVPMGSRSCLSLFGTKPDAHRLFADHLCAEFRIRTEGRGRTVDEWKIKPERPDNHWFDALVGCAVGASMGGVILPESAGGSIPKKRKRLDLDEFDKLGA